MVDITRMSHRSIVSNLLHVVWSTLERRPLLVDENDPLLRELLAEKARRLDSRLIACGCASDHVHVVVALHASRPLADLVQRMKGASAYELSRSARWPTPLRWQEGYWAESITPSSVRRAVDYVSNQRARHASGELEERWMGAPSAERAWRRDRVERDG